ncbi:MAG: hypothetical protein ACRDSJ_03030 [Rubrobacteraceae bacterium]
MAETKTAPYEKCEWPRCAEPQFPDSEGEHCLCQRHHYLDRAQQSLDEWNMTGEIMDHFEDIAAIIENAALQRTLEDAKADVAASQKMYLERVMDLSAPDKKRPSQPES